MTRGIATVLIIASLRIDLRTVVSLDVRSLAIPDVKLICPPKFGDHRGFFSETFSKRALVDGVAKAAAHPATFHIPSAEDIAGIKVGDYVKLGFVVDSPENLPSGRLRASAERMWVNVRSLAPFSGVLANDPVVLEDIKAGDTVDFESRHILDIISS